MIQVVTCLDGNATVSNRVSGFFESTLITLYPLKQATHKFSSSSMVIPSGKPLTPFFSKVKSILLLAKKIFQQNKKIIKWWLFYTLCNENMESW